MASTAGATGWLRGKVKSVTSGDCLVIIGSSKAEIPPEKTITLASLVAPRMARRGTIDEPFAWESREFLRKLCIGKEVTFKVDYSVPSIGREFGTVFLGDKNVALLVVSEGWAKVREQGQQKGEVSPFLAELQRVEELAKQEGLGRWSKVPGASELAIRNLPPSTIGGDPSNLDAMGLLISKKGTIIEAVVEQVRDGSTLRVYLLPDFQFVQVFVAGIQSPSMGRRGSSESVVQAALPVDEPSGDSSGEINSAPTAAQRLAASSPSINEVAPEPYAREAKHFTEIRVLNRDVKIVLEGVDKYSNLICSVYYQEEDIAKDLALELVENGLAKYVEWSANMMEEDARKTLKNADLQAKKTRLRMHTNYNPPASDSKAIHDQNFTGKVVEVASGDCVIVADDSLPYGDPLAERRVNLSSIRCPKMGNPRKDEKPAAYAREAKEFLRTRLIGHQVRVSLEYSRKVSFGDGAGPQDGAADSRVMDFGSVFLLSPVKDSHDSTLATPAASDQQAGVNVAELLVSRGFANVVRHRDFEERSNYYDALLSAENRAMAAKKGMHSLKEPPVMHVTDLLTASAKKTKDFLPFLQRSRRMSAVVEYVLSGHRFKLFVPKETCSIAFSFSGVRCPGRGEPYSQEASAFMRRKIMQRDVEIEVETVDRTGTFLGSLWDSSRTNMAVTLLEAGLARLQTSFGTDRIPDAHLLMQAEELAKKQKLKIWENFVEGEEVPNGSATEKKQKEEIKVIVTEVLGGGKFYIQSVADQRVASLQKQLSSLDLQDAPLIGTFNPKKGDLVLAQFSADNSWNRALIVNTPRGHVESLDDEFEVFYLDYGNQEVVRFSQLRSINPSVASAPGLAQLCSLAFLKVPTLEEDYGQEAAVRMSEHLLSAPKEFKAVIEERDTSGGKVKGQGTGTVFLVTLIDPETETSVNAVMLQDGLARLEKRRRFEPKDRQLILDELEKYQTEARKQRLGMWEYGDIQSDDEDSGPPARKPAQGRGKN